MARVSAETRRRQILTDFYQYFEDCSADRQQGIIDNLEIMRDLGARRRAKQTPAASPDQATSPGPPLLPNVDADSSGNGIPDSDDGFN